MARRIQDAYIVAACRTPVGKARGAFATTRPDDLLAHVLRGALDRCPGLSADEIGDVVVGCAMPEAEQGLNVARMGLLLAGYPDSIPGVTVNRFCASGLQAVAWAADRIRLGEADVMVAGGTETMSLIPMGGHHVAMNPRIFERDVGIAFGMGTTAEKVAERYKVSRDDQDAFALESHRRAVAAIDAGEFEDESIAVNVEHRGPGDADGDPVVRRREVATDEGPRRDASLEALTRLRPVFAAGGSVTAGNSSQMSDGAAAIVLVSESRLRSLGLRPLARFVGFSVAGVAPEVMGIGPVEAIPRVLDQTGLTREDMDWIELNEAFAAQSLAVIRSLDLAADKVNPLGGAIALGHPLGATGAIRVATLVHGLRRRAFRYGMVTMCVGTGMGAAGIFELA